jgi:hypothetical protein
MPHSSKAFSPSEPIRVDARGRLWWSSPDPAVRLERVRVIDHPDGGRTVYRVVVPAAGYLPEDIKVDPGDEAVLVVPREARRRAEVAALVYALRSVARSAATPGPASEPSPVLGAPSVSPLTTWGEVAEAIGVSEDTLARRRRRWKVPGPRPHFDDADAARAWYRTREFPPPVVEAPARKAPTPFVARPSAAPTTGLTLAELRARGAKGRP